MRIADSFFAEVNALQPGRKTDALVCEYVLGWHRIIDESRDVDGNQYNNLILCRYSTWGELEKHIGVFGLPNRGKIPFAYFCPHYTTESYDAVELMKRRSLVVGTRNHKGEGKIYFIGKDSISEEYFPESLSPTFELACCKAAIISEFNRRYSEFSNQGHIPWEEILPRPFPEE